MRVATIGYRLVTRNLDRCPAQAAAAGLLLHDAAAYPESSRGEVAARFGLGDGFGVLGVVAGSPAEVAGLALGDVILELEGAPVTALNLPATRREGSHDRIDSFLDLLEARLSRGDASLRVRRAGSGQIVLMPSRAACMARFALVPGQKPGAWSDERYVAVTQGMAGLADDDELAFAMAHELAHIVLLHGARRSAGSPAVRSRHGTSQDRERAADRLGLTLAIAAGYDSNGAERLLTRLAGRGGLGFSLSHPSFRSRVAALRQVVAGEMPTSAP